VINLRRWLLAVAVLIAGDWCQAAQPGSAGPTQLSRLPALPMRQVEYQGPIPFETLPQTLESPAVAHMTRADFEQIALGNHPAIATLGARISAARGRWVQVGLRKNPVVGYVGTDIGEGGSAGKQGGFVTQVFITADKRHLAREVVERELAQLHHELEVARRRVLGDVNVHFMESYFAQKGIEMVSQLAALAEQEVKAMQQLRAAQEVATLEVLTAQRLRDRIQLQLQQRQLQRNSAWQKLTAVAGRPDLGVTTLVHQLPTNLPPLVWETTRQQLLTTSPELASALAARETASWNLELARAQRYPNLQVTAGLQGDTLADETLANLSVGVPLPLFDRNQGAIAAAEGQLAAADSEINRVRLQLQRRLAILFQEYLVAHSRVEFFQQRILPNVEQSLQLAEEGFRQGQLDYLTVVRTRKELIQTKLEQLAAQEQIHARLGTLENLLLSDSLDQRAP
jgi:cobalt-zinc-cadmium efflux system outer membrane protein